MRLAGAQLDLVELVLTGVLEQDGFLSPDEGAPGRLAVALPVPAGTAAGDGLVLVDAEGVPVAEMTVRTVWPVPGTGPGALLASGPVAPRGALSHGSFRGLRRTPSEVRELLGDHLCVLTSGPVTVAELEVVLDRAAGRPVVLLALVGTGRLPFPTELGLVKSLLALGDLLPPGSRVVPVPLPLPLLAAAGEDASLRATAARAYGGAELVDLPQRPAAEWDALIGRGTAFPPAEQVELLVARPPLDRRGVVLLLSGLSGSGKSTIAAGVHEAIVERTDRTVTMLDGDVVRHHLSKGLGFSRADREANVERIGFVAAEVSRHGGIAVCAPIAPYESVRQSVRAMVEAAGGVFVLVHVATPLEVCEARDRKGLYAAARRGEIPEFTGISDPYEVPSDPDLRLDTSTSSVQDAVRAVLDTLAARGLLTVAPRPAPDA